MKIYNIDILSDIDLEMTPLTEDQEGYLHGGFIGIEGGAGIARSNGKCTNDNCPNTSCGNDSCENKGTCTNSSCSNGVCKNTSCPDITTSTKSKSIIYNFSGLILYIFTALMSVHSEVEVH